MAGLDPAIHLFEKFAQERWIRGSSPRMTPVSVTSIVLQQPLDVIELDLRTLRIGQTAAEFFENAAHPLHIDLARNLHGQVVAEILPVQRPSQRIALPAVTLLPAGDIAGAVALTIAVTLLHRLKALGPLAQGIQRFAL